MMPTLVLLVSTFADFKFKKVQNFLVLALLASVILFLIFFEPNHAWGNSFLGLGMAILLCLPLYIIQALGGADLKVFAIFGLATNSDTVLHTFLFSLFWGSALGVIKVILQGQGKAFLTNLKKIITLKKPDAQTVQKIPYTFALLLGWFTFLVFSQYGRIL